VSVPSLRRFREMLVTFAQTMPARVSSAPPRLEAVEGGQAA
jgi:hypothetical protein